MMMMVMMVMMMVNYLPINTAPSLKRLEFSATPLR
jgi:hypothetical protein